MELNLLEPLSPNGISGIVFFHVAQIMERLFTCPDVQRNPRNTVGRGKAIDSSPIERYGGCARKRRFSGVEGVEVVLCGSH
jgi:hypothetical protein